MPFFVFAWISSIFYGLEVVLGKLVSKYLISNPFLFGFIQDVLYTIFLIPLVLITKAPLPVNWGFVIALGFLGAVIRILYSNILFKTDVTVLSPMFNFRPAFSLMLATLFLGEIMMPHQ